MKTTPPESRFVSLDGLRLHYLDWGGDGPALVLLAGMGCSAYVFGSIAPRFTDRFHVLALDRRGHGESDCPDTGYDPDTLADDLRRFLDELGIQGAILAGHSMGYLELTRFSLLHPARALKLVFLDAAYDSSLAYYKEAYAQNPLGGMIPAWPEEDPRTFEEYARTVRRLYPALDVVWNDVMEAQTRHTVEITPEGRVRDKIPDAIAEAIRTEFATYSPDYSAIRCPVLSFFSIRDGFDFLSSEYMSDEQQRQVLDFFANVLGPCQRKQIEGFRQQLPSARIVEIPVGHHYCFLKHEDLVVKEMMAFLGR